MKSLVFNMDSGLVLSNLSMFSFQPLQLVSLKNFILVGDAMNSVDLLMYQQDHRTLAVVSRLALVNLSQNGLSVC